jgi:hypothetical protein
MQSKKTEKDIKNKKEHQKTSATLTPANHCTAVHSLLPGNVRKLTRCSMVLVNYERAVRGEYNVHYTIVLYVGGNNCSRYQQSMICTTVHSTRQQRTAVRSVRHSTGDDVFHKTTRTLYHTRCGGLITLSLYSTVMMCRQI